MDPFDVAVIGGGAAGFFGAIRCAERNPHLSIVILEQGANVLSKVGISGGGRCNLTHACFDPAELTGYYPRGGRELRGAFTRFQPKDTIAWFNNHGVRTKVEADGRVFPVTDISQTVIDCLIRTAVDAGVSIRTKMGVKNVEPAGSGEFHVATYREGPFECQKVLIATGGSRAVYPWLSRLGHRIQVPVPSLFTFTIRDPRLDGLAGISVENVRASLPEASLFQTGSMLVTHWGLSGPVALKLSAWGARFLHEQGYRAVLAVDWAPDWTREEKARVIREEREDHSNRQVSAHSQFGLPARLWNRLVEAVGIEPTHTWADLSKQQMERLVSELDHGSFQINGKSTYKEEFVTCGGVDLADVNFKTMESKKYPGLYLAGEVLDIDGLTGGFNFQSAWTTGWLAGGAIADALKLPG